MTIKHLAHVFTFPRISSVLVNKRLGTKFVHWFVHFFYWVFFFSSGFLSGVGHGGTDYAHAIYLLELLPSPGYLLGSRKAILFLFFAKMFL
jgi:hypothetical protein